MTNSAVGMLRRSAGDQGRIGGSSEDRQRNNSKNTIVFGFALRHHEAVADQPQRLTSLIFAASASATEAPVPNQPCTQLHQVRSAASFADVTRLRRALSQRPTPTPRPPPRRPADSSRRPRRRTGKPPPTWPG